MVMRKNLSMQQGDGRGHRSRLSLQQPGSCWARQACTAQLQRQKAGAMMMMMPVVIKTSRFPARASGSRMLLLLH